MTDTIVTFVLDKSGSMASCYDATIEAFNAYVKSLKEGDSGLNISFSLVQFDTVSIDTTWKNAPISDVTGLSRDNYKPHGGTPLIDAAYKAIKATEKRVAEVGGAPKVVICIQTDGQENSSREFTWEQLNDLIKEKTALGWQFNFMGVGLDAYTQSARMGLSSIQTMSYNSNNIGATRAAFAANAHNTTLYASGARGSTAYSSEQKLAAGDKHDPSVQTVTPDAAAAILQRDAKTRQSKAIVDDIDLSSAS